MRRRATASSPARAHFRGAARRPVVPVLAVRVRVGFHRPENGAGPGRLQKAGLRTRPAEVVTADPQHAGNDLSTAQPWRHRSRPPTMRTWLMGCSLAEWRADCPVLGLRGLAGCAAGAYCCIRQLGRSRLTTASGGPSLRAGGCRSRVGAEGTGHGAGKPLRIPLGRPALSEDEPFVGIDREVVPQHVADFVQVDPGTELASSEQVTA